MALQASGSIKFSDLKREFEGVTTAISLSSYVRGGSLVPSSLSENNAIASTTSNIKLSSYYSTIRRRQFSVTISSTTTNYVFNTAKVSGYISGASEVTLNIAPGVVVGSTAWNSYALTVDTSWNAGDKVNIVIGSGAYVVGKGGNGSNYYQGTGQNYYDPTYNGGYGINIQRPVNITNNGTIAKGGGGGYSSFVKPGYSNSGLAGAGGGGAGYQVGSGAGPITSWALSTFGGTSYSSAGTLTAGGSRNGDPVAGNGKNLGEAGYTESVNGVSPAVTGNSFITWLVVGTRLGPIV